MHCSASPRWKLRYGRQRALTRLSRGLHVCAAGLLLLTLPALPAADITTLPAVPVTSSTTFTGSTVFTDTELGFDADPLTPGNQPFAQGYQVGRVGVLAADTTITLDHVDVTLNANPYFLGNNFAWRPNTSLLSWIPENSLASSGRLHVVMEGGSVAGNLVSSPLYTLLPGYEPQESGGVSNPANLARPHLFYLPGARSLTIRDASLLQGAEPSGISILTHPVLSLNSGPDQVGAAYPAGIGFDLLLDGVNCNFNQIANLAATDQSTVTIRGGSIFEPSAAGGNLLALNARGSVDASTTGSFDVKIGHIDDPLTELRQHASSTGNVIAFNPGLNTLEGYAGPVPEVNLELVNARIQGGAGGAITLGAPANYRLLIDGNSTLVTKRDGLLTRGGADSPRSFSGEMRSGLIDAVNGGVADAVARFGLAITDSLDSASFLMSGGEIRVNAPGAQRVAAALMMRSHWGEVHFEMTGGLLAADAPVSGNIALDVRNNKGSSTEVLMSGGTVRSARRALVVLENQEANVELTGTAQILGRQQVDLTDSAEAMLLRGTRGHADLLLDGATIESGVTATWGSALHVQHNRSSHTYLKSGVVRNLGTSADAGSRATALRLVYQASGAATLGVSEGGYQEVVIGDGISPNDTMLLEAVMPVDATVGEADPEDVSGFTTLPGSENGRIVLRQGATLASLAEYVPGGSFPVYVAVSRNVTFRMEGGRMMNATGSLENTISVGPDATLELIAGTHDLAYVVATDAAQRVVIQNGFTLPTNSFRMRWGNDTLRFQGTGATIIDESISDASGKFRGFDNLELVEGATMSASQSLLGLNDGGAPDPAGSYDNQVLLSRVTPGALDGILTQIGSGQFIDALEGRDTLTVENITGLNESFFGPASTFRGFEVLVLGAGSTWTGGIDFASYGLEEVHLEGGVISDAVSLVTLGAGDNTLAPSTGFANPVDAGAGTDTLIFTEAAGTPVTASVNGTGSEQFKGFEAVIFRDGTNHAFTGLIRNDGVSHVTVTKDGGGQWAIQSAQEYTGGTTVSEGTLLLGNGTGSATGTGDVLVEASGVLAGTGAASGAVAVLGGKIAPGSSATPSGVEVLSVGPLALGENSEVELKLGSAGNQTRLHAHRLALVDPTARIRVVLDPSFVPVAGTHYDLLNLGTGSLPAGLLSQLVLPESVVWDTSIFASTGIVTVAVQAPVITAQPSPLEQYLPIAASASFSMTAIGAAPLNYDLQFRATSTDAWSTVSSAAVGELSRLILSESHYGQYRIEVTNSLGSAVSDTVVVAPQGPPVISAHPASIYAPEGAARTFSVTAAGEPTLTYQWQYRTGLGATWTNVAGATSSSLTVTAASAPVSTFGQYRVSVTNARGTATSFAGELSLLLPPVITAQPQGRQVIVGQAVMLSVGATSDVAPTYEWQYRADETGTWAKSRGLSHQATFAFIAGTNWFGQYRARVSNDAGVVYSEIADISLGAILAGSYIGWIERHDDLNQGMGGRLNFTVNSKGSYTGTLVLGVMRHTFKGRLSTLEDGLTLPVPRGGSLSPLTLYLPFDTESQSFTDAVLTDGMDEVVVHGWRVPWKRTAPASAWEGYYVAGIDLGDEGDRGDLSLPQGTGYLTFTIRPTDGRMLLVGRLADGAAVTCSMSVGRDGQLFLYQSSYGRDRFAGSALASMVITAGASNPLNTIAGSGDWTRPAKASGGNRLYQSGFTELPVAVRGGRYTRPAPGSRVLQLSNDAHTLEVLLQEAQVETALPLQPSLLHGTVGTDHVMSLVGDNPRSVSIALSPENGTFTGSFQLSDTREWLQGRLLHRKIDFRGVMLGNEAAGYFLLPQLPSASSELPGKTPIMSGSVVLTPPLP